MLGAAAMRPPPHVDFVTIFSHRISCNCGSRFWSRWRSARLSRQPYPLCLTYSAVYVVIRGFRQRKHQQIAARAANRNALLIRLNDCWTGKLILSTSAGLRHLSSVWRQVHASLLYRCRTREVRPPQEPCSLLCQTLRAKEACSKALGTGLAQGVFLEGYGRYQSAKRKPTMLLTNGAAERLEALMPAGHEAVIHLTITDDFPYAKPSLSSKHFRFSGERAG